MKSSIRFDYKSGLLIAITVFLLISAFGMAMGQSRDSLISVEVQRQLNSNDLNLYYPKTINRIYLQKKFKPLWINPQGGEGEAWQAMLLIDCVRQFGLSHADYHPKELLYDQ